jgi:hypothetical protein
MPIDLTAFNLSYPLISKKMQASQENRLRYVREQLVISRQKTVQDIVSTFLTAHSGDNRLLCIPPWFACYEWPELHALIHAPVDELLLLHSPACVAAAASIDKHLDGWERRTKLEFAALLPDFKHLNLSPSSEVSSAEMDRITKQLSLPFVCDRKACLGWKDAAAYHSREPGQERDWKLWRSERPWRFSESGRETVKIIKDLLGLDGALEARSDGPEHGVTVEDIEKAAKDVRFYCGRCYYPGDEVEEIMEWRDCVSLAFRLLLCYFQVEAY